ncbi:MAG: response regulator transcription factor [candidate division Zixibacteria bacterium]|nr:response regulator transcription factor [candidate division Zixibacteria bacterium]
MSDLKPGIVIVDAAPDDVDRTEACLRLRRAFEGFIMVLSPTSGVTDCITCLNAGADDYLYEPITPELLIARIKAMLRRLTRVPERSQPTMVAGGNGGTTNRRRVGNLTIDAASRSVQMGDRGINLTSAEFELLWLLARHPGQIISRDEIYAELRGFEYNGTDRSVDLRIARLRKKLGENGKEPQRIKTVRSLGYLLTLYA